MFLKHLFYVINFIVVLDYSYLEEALKVAEKFLNCVNENVRIKENQDRLDWLQQCVQNDLNLVFNSNTNKLGPRQLLHHSVLKKLKTNKELIGFLFNDFFLLVQPSKSVGTQFTFQRNTNIAFKMYKQVNLTSYFCLSDWDSSRSRICFWGLKILLLFPFESRQN